ncbi:MAG: 50S ribosomal protein L18 [Anaerolineaceae bacterium]|jgi:large subunit ribosomal protein L18|nr:50S ribosomal protein L18 [Anaerolineaceae bacterium]
MANKSRNAARLRRHARVRKKVFGTPERPRMNVYRSINEIYVQLIDDHSGTTLVSASTLDTLLRDAVKGKKKIEQAELIGEEIAKRSLEKGIKSVVMDRGGYYYTGRVKALADGARKGGLEF